MRVSKKRFKEIEKEIKDIDYELDGIDGHN